MHTCENHPTPWVRGGWARVYLLGGSVDLLNITQFRPQLNGGLGNTLTQVSPAPAPQGIWPGMTQNDNFGAIGMSTFDPRQIELQL